MHIKQDLLLGYEGREGGRLLDGREQAVILMADAAQRWSGISAVKSHWLSAHRKQAAASEVLG